MGISGWTYAGWRGDFYPRGLPQRAELAYAAERLVVTSDLAYVRLHGDQELYTSGYSDTALDAWADGSGH